ncbi:MAG: NFACT family protein [Synechococcaceae cyanobacterium]
MIPSGTAAVTAAPSPESPAPPAPAPADGSRLARADRPEAIQPLDITSLRAVLAELRPQLLPSRFEKAQQSDGQTLQLGLRDRQGHQWLELSWLAEAPRLLAIPAPPRRGEGSTLARQLQHGLRGLALVEIVQQGWERVVELAFAPRPGEVPRRWLVLELMGRHSNLFLLDGDRRVVALARQVRSAQSRLRPIATGDLYQPPPPLSGEAPRSEVTPEDWRRRLSLLPLPLAEALRQTFAGISPALTSQLLQGQPELRQRPVQSLSDAEWTWLWQRWRAWLEAVERQRFRFESTPEGGYRCWSAEAASGAAEVGSGTVEGGGGIPNPDGEQGARGDGAGHSPILAAATAAHGRAAAAPAAELGEMARVRSPSASGPSEARSGAAEARGSQASPPLALNQALVAYYNARLGRRRWLQVQAELHQRLQAALQREKGQLEQQQALLAAVPGNEELQQRAHALLSQPSPDREAIDAAQALYRKARKLRRSVEAITPRLELHQQRIEALEASLTFLEQADSLEQIEDLRAESEVGERRGRRPGASRAAARAQGVPQPLELASPSGLRLQVGRNHRQNDWISLKQARRGDLWFHAQECPGSHVVLKASAGPAAEADLAAAADLAAHFSRARGNARVPVLMVPVENLQRLPGAIPGTVRHRGGVVRWGEPSRAEGLLAAPNVSGSARP